jgi:hypothetical protein
MNARRTKRATSGLIRQRLRGYVNERSFMRKLVLLLGCAGVLALALAVAARAIPPEHFPVVHVDDTFTIPAAPEGPCAFAITGHAVGDVRHTHFFDQEGNLIRELTVFPRFRVTFSANGKSITTVSNAVEHLTINPDGSATIAITGLQGHLIVGGGPPLAADVGRLVLFFSGPEDEEPDIVFQAGKFNFGPFPQLCDVLADP